METCAHKLNSVPPYVTQRGARLLFASEKEQSTFRGLGGAVVSFCEEATASSPKESVWKVTRL